MQRRPSPAALLAGIGADAYIVTSNALQGSAVAVSPDGQTLVFMGARKVPGSRSQLWVRRLDQLQATPLDGTEGAFAPFFSPDSQSIAFFVGDATDGALKKIPVTGGASSRICAALMGRGGWWAEDGTIVFSQLQRTPDAEGGVDAVVGDERTGCVDVLVRVRRQPVARAHTRFFARFMSRCLIAAIAFGPSATSPACACSQPRSICSRHLRRTSSCSFSSRSVLR